MDDIMKGFFATRDVLAAEVKKCMNVPDDGWVLDVMSGNQDWQYSCYLHHQSVGGFIWHYYPLTGHMEFASAHDWTFALSNSSRTRMMTRKFKELAKNGNE